MTRRRARATLLVLAAPLVGPGSAPAQFTVGRRASRARIAPGTGTSHAIENDKRAVTLSNLTATADHQRVRRRIRCQVTVPVTFVDTVKALQFVLNGVHALSERGRSSLRVTYTGHDDPCASAGPRGRCA